MNGNINRRAEARNQGQRTENFRIDNVAFSPWLALSLYVESIAPTHRITPRRVGRSARDGS